MAAEEPFTMNPPARVWPSLNAELTIETDLTQFSNDNADNDNKFKIEAVPENNKNFVTGEKTSYYVDTTGYHATYAFNSAEDVRMDSEYLDVWIDHYQIGAKGKKRTENQLQNWSEGKRWFVNGLESLKRQRDRIQPYVDWLTNEENGFKHKRSSNNLNEVYICREDGTPTSHSVGVMAHDYAPRVTDLAKLSDPNKPGNMPDFLFNLASPSKSGSVKISADKANRLIFSRSICGVRMFQNAENNVNTYWHGALAYQPTPEGTEARYGGELRVEFYMAMSGRLGRSASGKDVPSIEERLRNSGMDDATQKFIVKYGKAFGHVSLSSITSAFLWQERRTFIEYMDLLNERVPLSASGRPAACSNQKFLEDILLEPRIVGMEALLFPGRDIMPPPEHFATWTRSQQALYVEKLRNTYFCNNNVRAFMIIGFQGPYETNTDSALSKDRAKSVDQLSTNNSANKTYSYNFVANYYVIVASCIWSSILAFRQSELSAVSPKEIDSYVNTLLPDPRAKAAFHAVINGAEVITDNEEMNYDPNNKAPHLSLLPVIVDGKEVLRTEATSPTRSSFLSEIFFPRRGTLPENITETHFFGIKLLTPISEKQVKLVRAQLAQLQQRPSLKWTRMFDSETVDKLYQSDEPENVDLPEEAQDDNDVQQQASSSTSSSNTPQEGGLTVLPFVPDASRASSSGTTSSSSGTSTPPPQQAAGPSSSSAMDSLPSVQELQDMSMEQLAQWASRASERSQNANGFDLSDFDPDNAELPPSTNRGEKRGRDSVDGENAQSDAKKQRDRIEAMILQHYPTYRRFAKFLAARLVQ